MHVLRMTRQWSSVPGVQQRKVTHLPDTDASLYVSFILLRKRPKSLNRSINLNSMKEEYFVYTESIKVVLAEGIKIIKLSTHGILLHIPSMQNANPFLCASTQIPSNFAIHGTVCTVDQSLFHFLHSYRQTATKGRWEEDCNGHGWDILQRPDSFGRFGKFGGKYVPETVMFALAELELAFNALSSDLEFQVSRYSAKFVFDN